MSKMNNEVTEHLTIWVMFVLLYVTFWEILPLQKKARDVLQENFADSIQPSLIYISLLSESTIPGCPYVIHKVKTA